MDQKGIFLDLLFYKGESPGKYLASRQEEGVGWLLETSGLSKRLHQTSFRRKIENDFCGCHFQPNNKKKELLLLLQRSSDKHGTHQGPVEDGGTQKIPKRLLENCSSRNGPHCFAHGRGRHFKLVRHVSYSRMRMLLNKFAIAMVSIVKHLNLQ
jgi:hypothetical protein